MIKSLDEFKAFLKICRKEGVTDVKFAGFSVAFGESPKKQVDIQEDGIMEGPTDEEFAFYSARSAIEDKSSQKGT